MTEKHKQSTCEVGDVHQPWFVFKNHRTGCPKDIDQTCLVCRVEQLDLDPKELVTSSFVRTTEEWMESCLDLEPKLCWKGEKGEDDIYYWPSRENLVESIREKGQKERIICTKHHAENVSTRIEFVEDPELTKIRIFEGHHRAAACLHLETPVKADVYHLYHMDIPIDWNQHYSSILEIMNSECGVYSPEAVSIKKLKKLIGKDQSKTDNPFRRPPHYFFGTPIKSRKDLPGRFSKEPGGARKENSL